MMKMIRNDIKKLVREEYEQDIREHGYAYSDHEALALLKEKICEAEVEMQSVRIYEDFLEKQVYMNNSKSAQEYIREIKNGAINGACKLIQVAAMCDKFQKSQEKREVE